MRWKLVRQLPGTLWAAVSMELLERLAYYGMFLVLGIYLVRHVGIRSDTFGLLVSIFTGALYVLPVFAGALADRYGYRPALALAFTTLAAGYGLLGLSTDFRLICLALGLIAVGGSIVKPTVSGTVTRTTEEGSTRPVGFGLYYITINLGGLVGPVVAAQVRNRTEFRYVFLVSAAACGLALLEVLLAYREPVPAPERGAGKTPGQVVREAWLVLRDLRFVALLVIFSGFWGMINVLFSFMPLFVETFTDLAPVEQAIDRLIPLGHWLNPEVFISLDAALIVLLQAPVSYLTRKWPTLRAMAVGTAVATLAWLLPALSPAAGAVAAGIAIWSVGEMTCSARFFEHCGSVAPPDRVAVYLGYSFLSIFLGNSYSGIWAGFLYRRFVEKPLVAGRPPLPAAFFAGVMLMGAVAVVGLLVLRRWLSAPRNGSR